jgi:hypothetical protein
MTRFRAETVNGHPPFAGHTVCLNCRREFIVAEGRVVTFYAEGEPVGFVCNACVSSEARELLRSKKA